MLKSDERYRGYISILREELIPAMGCTEPIAIAYAAARARDLLGRMPEKVKAEIGGSIIKNVKSVIVPHTGHQKGIETALAAGIAAGKAERRLEVIADVTEDQIQEIRAFRENTPIAVTMLDSGHVFDMIITLMAGEHTSRVRITNHHTNIILEEKDGVRLLERSDEEKEEEKTDRSILSMEGIWDFVQTMDPEDVEEILQRQIDCNMAISQEGMRGDYGANIGRTLLKTQGEGVRNRAKAAAAAGSDARMNGCEMPVIINSGSGNQGMTASIPVIVYARELGASREQLYRALCLSNLTAIHQKTMIGALSAYCGAVNAGAGAGCGIAYLLGGDYKTVIHTLVNALAIISGMICDGAKSSCAAKIAMAVEAGLMGYEMYMNGQQFRAGEGIVGKGVERNIHNVGRLGKYGMQETNQEIIQMMIGC